MDKNNIKPESGLEEHVTQFNLWKGFPHLKGFKESNDIDIDNELKKQTLDKTNDQFWLKDPYILFKKDKLIEFYPDSELSTNEQLNAITRFIVYFGALLFIITGNFSSIFLIGIGIVMIIFIHEHGMSYFGYKVEDFIGNYSKDDEKKCLLTMDKKEDKNVCQSPTRENPFMNVLISDYVNNPRRPPACHSDDPEIKDEIRKHFNSNLYLDVDDIWEKRNGQREFITQPNTQIPNDREKWSKWCFDDRSHACKENYICKNDFDINRSINIPSQIFKDM